MKYVCCWCCWCFFLSIAIIIVIATNFILLLVLLCSWCTVDGDAHEEICTLFLVVMKIKIDHDDDHDDQDGRNDDGDDDGGCTIGKTTELRFWIVTRLQPNNN